MELILGYEILESYKRLPYKAWFAFAEFVDNSTQSYRNNKTTMDKWFEEEDDMLTVIISYDNKKDSGFIKIEDNAYGMNNEDLQSAMTLGKKPDIHNERSKYGLGLKTAAFWFGNKWSIRTTQKGSSVCLTINIDLYEILQQEKVYYQKFKEENPGKPLQQFRPQLDIISAICDSDEHGTTLVITDLVRKINTPTSNSCVEYLQSIYRYDLQNELLYLEFQGTALDWDKEEIYKRLLVDATGARYYRKLDFTINGKTVEGWAGILSEGSKKSGGFSLVQADRVIVGYPKNYKNPLIFGPEDGGRNDLTNQRLTGELKLDERFGVSHTKDQILFADDEEDELDNALFERLADYKREANIPYKHRTTELTTENEFDFNLAVKSIIKNLETPAFQDVLLQKAVLPIEAIVKTNQETIQRINSARHTSYTFSLDGDTITIVLSDESSAWDPYLIVKPLGGTGKIIILLNIRHPYWLDLPDNKSRFNFLLSCLYDGVSEWKAGFRLNRLDPDTIKIIKDSLLRLPLTEI